MQSALERVVRMLKYANRPVLIIVVLFVMITGDLCGQTHPPDTARQNSLRYFNRLKPRLKSILVVESGLLQRACKLTPSQTARLDGFDDKWLDGVIEQVLEKPATEHLAHDLFAATRSAFMESIREDLTDDQSTGFMREVELRDKYQHDATVKFTVALLDEYLTLTDVQLEKISDALGEWANTSDAQDLLWMSFLQNKPYIPRIPLDVILPLVTEKQKTMLGSLPMNRSQLAPDFVYEVITP